MAIDTDKEGRTGDLKDSDSGREPIVGGEGNVVVNPTHPPDSDNFSNSATTGIGPKKNKGAITGSGIIVNK